MLFRSSLGVDFLSFSGHKFSAPKGIAGLYVKEDSQLTPLIYGGSQERKLRASTENVPGIIALAEAIKTIDPNTYIAQIQPLRAQLLSGLETLTHPSLIHNNFSDKVLSNTINVAFPGVSGHTLAMQLDLAGIEASTGSACSVGAIEPSHVLEACGVPKDINLSSLRISLGLETSPQDIDYLLSTLSDLLSRTH